MKKLLLISSILLISGCATTSGLWEDAESDIKSLASFDLSCPKEQIKLTKLNEECVLWECRATNVGAEGCGKKARYTELSVGKYAANFKSDQANK